LNSLLALHRGNLLMVKVENCCCNAQHMHTALPANFLLQLSNCVRERFFVYSWAMATRPASHCSNLQLSTRIVNYQPMSSTTKTWCSFSLTMGQLQEFQLPI
jgi:hypothetical protein